MNTTLPDSNCSALGTRSVDSFGECNCRTAFCGTFCEKYCVEDPNYYLAFLILHQILYPVFNALLILFGLIVVINFWKQGQKKRKSIAAFALYGFILCCLLRTMYGINPFTAIPTVDFGQIPFSIIYNVPQGLFIFAYLLILAAWLQIFARANKGGTVRVKQTVIVVVVIASLWITFVTTISIFAIDASIRDIIFLIVNYSYVTTVFVMAVVELVLAIYALGHFKKSPQQVSKSNLKKILKTMSINILISMCGWLVLVALFLVFTIRQPWNWEALIFHTLFRVIEVILIFLGIRMIGAGSLLLELKYFAYHLGLAKDRPPPPYTSSDFISSSQ